MFCSDKSVIIKKVTGLKRIAATIIALLCCCTFLFGCVVKPDKSDGEDGQQGGEVLKPTYEGLHFTGDSFQSCYAGEKYTVKFPSLSDKDGKSVDLEIAFTVYDNNYSAQGKDGNAVTLPAGVYSVTFTLKDRTYECESFKATLNVVERNRVTISAFSSPDDLDNVKAQPTGNFGTNNGVKSWASAFGGFNGLLKYDVGAGSNGTAQGDRDGFYVGFSQPIELSKIQSVGVVVYINGGRETRLALGFKLDGTFTSDSFWLMAGKNVWNVRSVTGAEITEKFETTAASVVNGIFVRFPYATYGECVYIDEIYYIEK